MRELGVGRAVLEDVAGLAPGDGRLDVEEVAVRRLRAAGAAVADGADRAVGERASRRRIGPDRPRVDVDRDTEIDLALADRVPEILELESSVHARVARDDEPAAAPHQLVDPEVLEVAPVAQVHVLRGLVRHAQELGQEVEDPPAGAHVPPLAELGRILEPPSEAHVEHGHQERDRGRGVVALVRARGSARHGQRGAEPQLERPRIRIVLRRGAAPPAGLRPAGQPRLVLLAEVVLGALVAPRGQAIVVLQLVPAEERARHERRRLALLPRQARPAGDVQRGVHEVVGPLAQVLHRHGVVAVEAREGMVRAARIAGAEVAANQPVPVEHVEREHVDVDPPREEGGEDRAEQEGRQEALQAEPARDGGEVVGLGRRERALPVPGGEGRVDPEGEGDQEARQEHVGRDHREPVAPAHRARLAAPSAHRRAHPGDRGHQPGDAETLGEPGQPHDPGRRVDGEARDDQPPDGDPEQDAAQAAPPLSAVLLELTPAHADDEHDGQPEHAEQSGEPAHGRPPQAKGLDLGRGVRDGARGHELLEHHQRDQTQQDADHERAQSPSPRRTVARLTPDARNLEGAEPDEADRGGHDTDDHQVTAQRGPIGRQQRLRQRRRGARQPQAQGHGSERQGEHDPGDHRRAPRIPWRLPLRAQRPLVTIALAVGKLAGEIQVDEEHGDREPQGGAREQGIRPVVEELPGPREQSRQKQDDREAEEDDREIEDEVPEVRGHRGEGVRAEDPRPRGEVVAVAPKERHLLRLDVGVVPDAELLLDRVHARAMDPRREPAPDVAAARHGREVVELLEEAELRQGLEHAEVERGAADAAAREGEAQELVLVVRRAVLPRARRAPLPELPQELPLLLDDLLEAVRSRARGHVTVHRRRGARAEPRRGFRRRHAAAERPAGRGGRATDTSPSASSGLTLDGRWPAPAVSRGARRPAREVSG